MERSRQRSKGRESAYMFSPDNDFSNFENINFCVYNIIISIDIGSYIIVIAYAFKGIGFYYMIVIAYDFKDDIILDVIDDSCST